MYIKLREGEYEISEEIREGIIVDFDKNNEIIGIVELMKEVVKI